MRPTARAWDTYGVWNEVLADVLFPVLDQPVAAYLDLERSTLSAIAERVGLGEGAVEPALLRAVAATVDPESTNGFTEHHDRLGLWLRDRHESTNPVIALLAVFSLAAERMASSDGMSASNYYGRLAECLGGGAEQLGQSYRKVAEPFWGSLNLWLTAQGGARGLPTAYSVGLRYVGLAVSQALVREADRRRLEKFFSDFDLAPRSELPPAELVPLLRSWIEKPHSPANGHLVTLWRKPALQERIAEVAATLLSEWDGTSTEGDGNSERRGRALLSLSLTTFPRRRARLLPLFFFPEPEREREALLQGDRDQVVKLEQVTAGAMTFSDPGLVDSASLLEGILTVLDDLAGIVTRSPRSMVVFRLDDLSGTWLEVKQVLLGDDVVILVARRFLNRVIGHLAHVARPGWHEEATWEGIPPEWVMLRDVEIFARPSIEDQTHLDLRALVPLTSNQLKIAGGFSLPGALRNRWHALRPPEVRAVTDSGEPFVVRLLDLGPPDATRASENEIEIDEWSDGGSGVVVQGLAELELEDGNYAVELRAGTQLLSRKEITLRSSDTHDASLWSRVESIVHELGDPLSVLGAGTAGSGGTIVQGTILEKDPRIHSGGTSIPLVDPWWHAEPDQERTRAVVLQRPLEGSCFYTGNHRILVDQAEVDKTGRPLVDTTMGTCHGCGLQKRYPASYWKSKRDFERKRAAAATRRAATATMPAVAPSPGHSTSENWDIALDSLRYAGGGPISILERVARQIDPGRAFVREFTRTLESLGHIEVRRSPQDLTEVAWEICPTTIVDTGDRRVLTGFWSPADIEDARRALESRGLQLARETQEAGPARWSTSATNYEILECLAIDGDPASGRAGMDLAEGLPRLSSLLNALPRHRAAAHREVQWFDPARAAWLEVDGMDGVGAYRVGRFSARYYLRTRDDVADGTIAVGDVYMVKHGSSSILANRALLSYSASTRELKVPLGANLPGMYQRAVVLDSGWAPLRRAGALIYTHVAPDIAARIAFLLTN